jgi:uncharacterized protein (DUF4415 family)
MNNIETQQPNLEQSNPINLVESAGDLNDLGRDINFSNATNQSIAQQEVLRNEVMSYPNFMLLLDQISHQLQEFKDDGSRKNRNSGKRRKGTSLNQAGKKGLERVHNVSDQRLRQLAAMKNQLERAYSREANNPAQHRNITISEDLVNKLRSAQGQLSNLRYDREQARG